MRKNTRSFGSGLVIAPFLEQGLGKQYGWMDEHQFLIAVAVGMISPGPVVITATFVGYLVAGFWGSLQEARITLIDNARGLKDDMQFSRLNALQFAAAS